uniref:Uncharacterized protein n=1 Tax=Candidatus Kentrum sp. DK TaxID=2126562 RepID=A0A450S956_9GAMM|nr:MAG: hypothetical protein BECKDK2373B_GA0170837_102060 [Candidatus Kentron sp. DK]VFJ57041.1 MAG: hypothetical protein BECKDK2373C_GA0170839_10577 [Candidatus Kentron sp. DK]
MTESGQAVYQTLSLNFGHRPARAMSQVRISRMGLKIAPMEGNGGKGGEGGGFRA